MKSKTTAKRTPVKKISDFQSELKELRKIGRAMNYARKKYYKFPDRKAFRQFESKDLTKQVDILDAYNDEKKGTASSSQLKTLKEARSEIKNLDKLLPAFERNLHNIFVLGFFMDGADMIKARDMVEGYFTKKVSYSKLLAFADRLKKKGEKRDWDVVFPKSKRKKSAVKKKPKRK
jgi:hypothetical protein